MISDATIDQSKLLLLPEAGNGSPTHLKEANFLLTYESFLCFRA